MKVQLDTLVRGTIGVTETVRTMRVYRVLGNGQVAGIDADDGRQHLMDDGNFEVIGEPRPVLQRRDIPKRFQ